MTRWIILRSRLGRYHNSPPIWTICGVIEAETARIAWRVTASMLGPRVMSQAKVDIAIGQHYRCL